MPLDSTNHIIPGKRRGRERGGEGENEGRWMYSYFKMCRLEKWLFIPHTGADILDKRWLFGNEYN